MQIVVFALSFCDAISRFAIDIPRCGNFDDERVGEEEREGSGGRKACR